jgi:uncharacterized protein YyaL (SSP411 family)
MTAVQAMTGQGGWPMSVFLTPDGQPFWAATYLPDRPRHGMPSFRQVLEGIADAWESRRTEIAEQASAVTAAIDRAGIAAMGAAGAPDPSAGVRVLRDAFDPAWGGFGGAPKFPNAPVLEWLLRRAVRGDDDAERMVVTTLERLANGGIHDHVAGGFARYSTDREWHVPHFEKMLYDNAQLLTLFTRAWLHTRAPMFRDVAVRTADALLETFGLDGGGFASSTDADSDGVEGAFATWTWDELVETVGPEIAEAFGAVPEGNWEGTNVLWRPEPLSTLAARIGADVGELAARLEHARAALAERRTTRPQPARDDKVVTAWNGLAITGLTVAARAFHLPRLLEAAERCASFLWDEVRVDGRLQRSWRDGRTSGGAFLDDHALFATSLLTLFETTGDVRWFERASTFADDIERLFLGAEGPLLTGSDTDPLIVRPRERTDDVTPGGAAATAELFLRLSHLTGDLDRADRAREIVSLVGDAPARIPLAFGHTWCVLDRVEGPFREIAVVGDPRAEATVALLDEAVAHRYLPNAEVAVGPPADGDAGARPALFEGRAMLEGRPAAYVCEGFACRLPVSTPEVLVEQHVAARS